MASTRALIEMVVEGAAESRRRLGGVGDEMRRLNSQSLQNLSSQVSGLNDRISGLQSTFGNIAGFAIAGVSLATLGSRIGDVINSMGELDDLSQKVGTSVESLSKIQKVAKAFDVDFAGSVDPALVKLARGLTTVDEKSSKTAKALAAIGVSAKDSAGKLRDPGEVMVEVAKNLQWYEDTAGKAALANDLFGKSGVDLLPFFNDLADNVDNFSAVSGEAVAQATALQDKLTGLGQRIDEVFTDVTVAALPALTDLADGFADVMRAEDGLVGGEMREWADDLALGLSRVADVALFLVRGNLALASSFAVVAADISVFQKMSEVANPINAAKMVLQGRSPTDELKKVLAERNKVLEDANERWNTFINKQGNPFEQAFLNRKARRGAGSGEDDPKTGGPTKTLNYSFGEDETTKNAIKALNEYEALLDRISGKSVGIDADFYANLGKLHDGYTEGKQSLDEYVDTVATYISQQQFVKQAEDERTKSLELYQKALDAASSGSMKAATELQSQRDENEQIGLETAALGELKAARLEDLALRAEANAWMADGLDITGALSEEYRKEAAALRERAQAVREGAAMQANADAVKKAGEDLDRFLDPTKAQTFGDALKGAFGAAGDSMTQLISGLDAYGIRQAEIDKARKDAAVKYASDSKGFADATAAISAKEVKSRISGYGDMASAAKGFFNENSSGYEVLAGAEKAFRAIELANQMESLYTHLFVTTAKASGTAAGQGVETAAVVAGEAARNTAKVPGVFMSFMSALGPWGMAAAGVAIAAVLGGAFGGGGSVNLPQQRQERQGTGTVLGSDAKSESIGRALDAIEGATLQGLGISNDMLTSLRNIEAGIEQFASLLVRTTGVTGDFGEEFATRGSADAFGRSNVGVLATGGLIGMALDKITGGLVGKITGSVLGKIFGGKTTVEDTGFMLDSSSFANILAGGVNAFQYADIKKDGGWFSSDKYSTKTEGLGVEGNRQIANVLMSLYDTVFEAGKMLDIGSDAFSAQLSSFVVDIGKVSLKGLSNDEIEKELSAVFSSLGDELAKFGVGGLEQFQTVGEGYLETLSRVATNYQAVAVVTDSLGMAFTAMGLASVDARERLVNLVGGLDEFTSSADQFLNDFYTDQERANSLRARIAPTLDQFGIKTGAQDSLQQFRSVVTGLDLTTEAGARAYATLMQIAPAFKQIADVDAKIFEERSDLQRELDELTLSEAVLLAQQRAALDESNRALFDQIQAVKAKTAADEAATAALEKAKSDASALMGNVDSAFSVLQRVVDRQKKAVQDEINVRSQSIQKIQALSQSLRSALDGMTAQGREAEDRQVAQAQIQAALAIARASGKLPDAADLRSALSVVGRSSADQFATQQDYLRDFYATRAGIEDLSGLTDKSLSVEERSLKSLESQIAQYDLMLEREQEQIDVLKGISITGLSIEQALEALRGAVLAAGANPVNAAGSAINDAYKSALGRAPDKAGLDFWTDKAAGGVSTGDIIDAIKGSPEAQIRGLYREIFGRAPDAGGLQFWVGQMNNGMPLGTIRDAMLGSDEKMKRIPGFAAGGDHIGGWRIVGENGPELEATGAARIFNAGQTRDLMAGMRAPAAGTDALVAEVRLLRRQVESLQRAAESTATNTARSADSTGQLAEQFENATDGGNAMRTDVVTVVRTKEVA